ncbi:hypothetical protein NLI96_g6114 [Meripilus lineatus]|uniref:Uncharacterized protein n=1 Tax=Meripilus lineatus TaxID=2056292 RepID=A0AAD5V1J9_9APHY|nr:hypothetical protein NLI96_g6114 [Physisporinus lineatus]
MRFSVVAAVSIAASCVLPVLAAPTPVFDIIARRLPGPKFAATPMPRPDPHPRPRPRDVVQLEERSRPIITYRPKPPMRPRPRDFVELKERSPQRPRPTPRPRPRPRDFIDLEERNIPRPRPTGDVKPKPRDLVELEKRRTSLPSGAYRHVRPGDKRPRGFTEFESRSIEDQVDSRFHTPSSTNHEPQGLTEPESRTNGLHQGDFRPPVSSDVHHGYSGPSPSRTFKKPREIMDFDARDDMEDLFAREYEDIMERDDFQWWE